MTYLEMNQSSSLKRATVQSNNSSILWIKNQLHMNLCVVPPKGCQNILKMDVISLGMISRSFLLCWAILFALPALMLMYLFSPKVYSSAY